MKKLNTDWSKVRAADKAGATNIQMCLYQDLVEARAALADQAL